MDILLKKNAEMMKQHADTIKQRNEFTDIMKESNHVSEGIRVADCIKNMICPDCGVELKRNGRCKVCICCGFSTCSR